MARRLLPLTVLTGIFAAVGTGFLVLLFGPVTDVAASLFTGPLDWVVPFTLSL